MAQSKAQEVHEEGIYKLLAVMFGNLGGTSIGTYCIKTNWREKQYKDHWKAGLEVSPTAKPLLCRKQIKDVCAESSLSTPAPYQTPLLLKREAIFSNSVTLRE